MRRALLALALLIAALLLAVMGTGWWLAGSESGAGFLLERVRALTGATLDVGRRQGALLGPFDWGDLVYEDRYLRVTVRRVALRWQPSSLLQRRLVVESLEIEGVELQLKPQPQTPPDPEPGPPLVRLPLDLDLRQVILRELRVIPTPGAAPIEVAAAELVGRWSGSDIEIERLLVDYPAVGRAQAAGKASLTTDGVQLSRFALSAPFPFEAEGFVGYQKASDLRLAWKQLRWPLAGEPQVASAEGRAELHGPWSQLDWKLDAALGAQGRVQGQGRWSGELEARLQWKDLGYPLLDPQAPWRTPQGSLRFQGLPERYDFELQAELLAREQRGRLDSKGSGSTEAVDLERLQLSVGQGALEAAGRVAWSPQLSGDLRGSIRKLDPALLAPDWPGQLNGRFGVQGEMAGELPALRFELQLADSKLRGYPLSLDTRGRYAAEVLEIAELELHSGGSVLEASGRASAPYDLQAELVSQNLAELWPGAAGSARLEARLQGQLATPHLVAEGELVRASLGDYAVSVVQLDADLDWNGALRLDLEAKDAQLGTLLQKIELHASGQRAAHRLRLSAEAADGAAELELAGGWDERRRRWQGQLASGRLAPAQLAPWVLQAPAELMLAADRADLAPACWTSDPGRSCVELHYTPQATRAALGVEQLAFAYFQALLPQELQIEGSVSGSADAELAGGQLRQARVELATTAGALKLRDQRFGFQPATLNLRDGSEGSAQLRLPLEVGGIELDARLAPGAVLAERALAGELRLDFPDLGFVSLLSPEIGKAAGRLVGRYQLAGLAGKPELQGEALLSDGRFSLSRPGIELTEVGARLTGVPGGHVELEAHARSGGGSLQLQGQIDREGEDGMAVQLTVKGSDFQAANLPQARVWVSPDLALQLAGGEAKVKGSVTVPRAEFRLQTTDAGVAPSSDQVIVDASGQPQEVTEATKLTAEVRLVLGDKVSLEGQGLKTRLEGAITAIEQPGRETLGLGELRLVEGRYKAYGQDLQIETGKLLFNGGPIDKPGLEIRAVRRPTEDVLVGIHVRGTLEKPQLSLYSEPGMTQQQQLSWLLLGRPMSNGDEDRDMLSNAAMALGLGGSNLLAQSVRGGLGVDEISVGAKPGESSDKAMFTVGKYLSPKLFVSYGQGIFQPGSLFTLLYDLGHGFKLSTESGVATGGDVLYTVERP